MLLIAVATVLAVYVLPPLLVSGSIPFSQGDSLRAKAENDARGTLLTALGAFILGGIAYLSYRLTQRGQVTDRFTKAIDQLGQQGNDRLDIRIGGIYALEQIARDSSQLHWPVMAVLTAFIREHRPWSLEWTMETATEVGADIQAALTVLARRRVEHDQGPLDLSETNLRKANLGLARFGNIFLMNTNLQGAHLVKADLEEATLWGASLQGAKLIKANLRNLHGGNVNLEAADLSGADLQGAFFLKARLSDAKLVGADLRGATMWDTDYWKADLAGADVRDVDTTSPSAITALEIRPS